MDKKDLFLPTFQKAFFQGHSLSKILLAPLKRLVLIKIRFYSIVQVVFFKRCVNCQVGRVLYPSETAELYYCFSLALTGTLQD